MISPMPNGAPNEMPITIIINSIVGLLKETVILVYLVMEVYNASLGPAPKFIEI